MEPRDHGVEHEADVRYGRSELSPNTPSMIHFGVFAYRKPCLGFARVKSRVNPCSASGAVVPGNATRRRRLPKVEQINSDRLLVLCFLPRFRLARTIEDDRLANE